MNHKCKSRKKGITKKEENQSITESQTQFLKIIKIGDQTPIRKSQSREGKSNKKVTKIRYHKNYNIQRGLGYLFLTTTKCWL